MGPNDVCMDIKGSFSWGFTSSQPKKDEKKGKKSAVIEEESKKEQNETRKMLSKFITLKDIKIQIRKGEFVIVIGDVGSGKSSLLHSIIGDLIYIPQVEIDEFGGLEHEGTQEEFDSLKNKLLGSDFICD